MSHEGPVFPSGDDSNGFGPRQVFRASVVSGALIDHDGTKERVGQALTPGAGQHHDDRDDLENRKGHADEIPGGVGYGFAGIHPFTKRVAQLDPHEPHPKRCRPVGDGHDSVDKADNRVDQREDEKAQAKGQEKRHRAQQRDEGDVKQPCDKPLGRHGLIEFWLTVWVGQVGHFWYSG